MRNLTKNTIININRTYTYFILISPDRNYLFLSKIPGNPISVSLFILFLFLSGISDILSARHPDIYWNSTNPIFRIDNTDHIIDVNRGNVAYEYDQVNTICPFYPSSTRSEDMESYVVYNVFKTILKLIFIHVILYAHIRL